MLHCRNSRSSPLSGRNTRRGADWQRSRHNAPGPSRGSRRSRSEPAFGCSSDDQKKLMYWRKKKRTSAAARFDDGEATRSRFHVAEHVLELRERLPVEMVVDPASFAPVVHQPGILQDFEVEGKPRLRRFEQVREIADAPFAVAQALYDF